MIIDIMSKMQYLLIMKEGQQSVFTFYFILEIQFQQSISISRKKEDLMKPKNNQQLIPNQNNNENNHEFSSIINPLKRSASQKNFNDSLVNLSSLNSSQMKNPSVKPSPMKKKSQSVDKDMQIFSTTKNYGQQISPQNSMIFSQIAQIAEQLPLKKQVKFRQNLIMKNNYNRKEKVLRQSRTPSILKRSQLLRNNASQFIQQNSTSNAQKHPNNIVEDREERVAKSNQVIKRRYSTIIQRYQSRFINKIKRKIQLKSEEKYKDELFPPILSSIFRGSDKNQYLYSQNIKWVRIPDLFKQKKLVVVSNTSKNNLGIVCNHGCNNFIGQVFSCIKNCKFILQKMFQSCKINEFGVFLVKIFQENVWKYIIVDDFIPAIQDSQGQLQPYFLNCGNIQEGEELQIWPFILEKAYANYYSNYESLHYGNTLDFMEEILGTAGQMFRYVPNNKKLIEDKKRLRKLFAIQDSIAIGYLQSQNSYIPIYKNEDGSLIIYLSKQQTEYSFHLQSIFQYFDRVFVFNPRGWTFSAVSPIGINIKRNQNIFRFDISMRTLKLTQPGSVSISIRQKQKRFYQKSSLNYSYIWVRVILLQKQFDGDCRWIDAKYSNVKSINFFKALQAGQYYIIVIPQWKSSHCYQLSCIINSNVSLSLNKRQYDDNQLLVEKGCCDLAQRQGKLHQINLYACSYSYIHQEIGILVENINNQRYNGDIKINRSIVGLRSKVEIIPFNKQFYNSKNNKTPFKTQISIYIPADYSFTVILMMKGGLDIPFLRKFDFGK